MWEEFWVTLVPSTPRADFISSVILLVSWVAKLDVYFFKEGPHITDHCWTAQATQASGLHQRSFVILLRSSEIINVSNYSSVLIGSIRSFTFLGLVDNLFQAVFFWVG